MASGLKRALPLAAMGSTCGPCAVVRLFLILGGLVPGGDPTAMTGAEQDPGCSHCSLQPPVATQ